MTEDETGHGTQEPGPRQKLLNATIELMAREGSGDWTLRRLAEAIGTSHRMVIYHFGSLEGLRLAVVQEVEHRESERREQFANRNPSDSVAVARDFRRELSRPETAPRERLFFELFVAGLQGSGAIGVHAEGVDGAEPRLGRQRTPRASKPYGLVWSRYDEGAISMAG